MSKANKQLVAEVLTVAALCSATFLASSADRPVNHGARQSGLITVSAQNSAESPQKRGTATP